MMLNSFRSKLIWLFISVLSLSLVSIIYSLYAIRETNQLDHVKTKVLQSQTVLKTMQNDMNKFFHEGFKESSFHETGKSQFLVNLDSNKSIVDGNLNVLIESEILASQEDIGLMKELRYDLDKYAQLKVKMVGLYATRGFKDYGLEGELRKTIKMVEKTIDAKYLSEVLMLRRNEKDFFLRKNKKYLSKFNTNIDILISKVIDDKYISKLLYDYKEKFKQIVDLEESIGFKSNLGIRREISESQNRLQNEFSLAADHLMSEYAKYSAASTSLTILLFLLQVFIGVLISIRFANRISRSTSEIRDSMLMISEGEFPDKMEVVSDDEIGQIKEYFNLFVDRIKEAVSFSKSLGEGDLDKEYNQEFSDDVLAKSIILLQSQLVDANKEQQLINWTNQGLAEFNTMIQNDNLKLEELGDSILSFVIAYLNANQGAIYLTEEKDSDSKYQFLTRLTTYAYDKKKFVEDKIKFGQGLAGQCAKEGLPINLKDVPSNYINITSGLGESTPKHVYITPLIVRDEVFGVFEIAGFSHFEEYQIEFVEKLTEIIANVLSSKKMTLFTNTLLDETREKAEIMMQQEEELKQTNEEIQATREDLENRVSDLERENASLRAKLS